MRYLDDKNFKYFMEKMNKLKIVGHLNKKKKSPEFLKSVLDRIYGDYLGLAKYRKNREEIIENILKQTELKVFADVCREIDMAIELFEEQDVCGDLIHMGFVYKKTMKKSNSLLWKKIIIMIISQDLNSEMKIIID